jgi:hypothetical protein
MPVTKNPCLIRQMSIKPEVRFQAIYPKAYLPYKFLMNFRLSIWSLPEHSKQSTDLKSKIGIEEF